MALVEFKAGFGPVPAKGLVPRHRAESVVEPGGAQLQGVHRGALLLPDDCDETLQRRRGEVALAPRAVVRIHA